MPLLKPNGFILVDNVFYSGAVLVPDEKLVDALKEKFANDEPKYLNEPQEALARAKAQENGKRNYKQLKTLMTILTMKRIDATMLSTGRWNKFN